MSCWANINHLRSKVKGRCHTPRWANQGNLSAHEKYLLLHSYLEEVGKTAEPEKSLWLTMSTFGFFSHFFPMWTCESGRFMAVTSPSHLSFSFLWKNVTCFASPHSPSIKNNSTHFFFPSVYSKYKAKVTVVVWRQYFPTNTEILIKQEPDP